MIDFETALKEFSFKHWPCEYQDRKIQRCVNTHIAHGKGHQDVSGKVVPKGLYVSSFSPEKYARSWMESLDIHLRVLERQLDEQEKKTLGPDCQKLHARQHKDVLVSFYKKVGGASNYTHHATCLCCLMRPPEFPLACGHVLCSECAKVFGRLESNNIVMTSCPLHETRWAQEWKIRLKPKFAGVRILSLDGYVDSSKSFLNPLTIYFSGGVRGIVELEVLREIQKMIRVNIPIIEFFDLVVGTRYESTKF
jgi:hypothetical protein